MMNTTSGTHLGLLEIVRGLLFELERVQGVGGGADLGRHGRVIGEGDERLRHLVHVVVHVHQVLQGAPQLVQIDGIGDVLHVVEVVLEVVQVGFHVRRLEVGGYVHPLGTRRCRTGR